VRRSRVVATVLVALLLILAGTWFGISGRRGLTPVEPVTPGAEDIDDLYLFISFFAIAIFLSVTIPLALIIARYREKEQPREVEGPQIRGSTALELLWTATPLLIVSAIAGFTLFKAASINDLAGASEQRGDLAIAVEGRQFYWRYVYENGAVAIDRLRVPVDRVVDLEVTAPDADVNHSFWAPAIGGKIDAIPGVTNHLKFQARKTGVFPGRCAELCGIQHSAMTLAVEVLPADEFDRWLERAGSAQGEPELGVALFEGVCTKCHFAAPEYAPNIAGNPTLADAEAIRQLVENGGGQMPAVGRDWSERELRALTAHLKTLAPREGASGG
jgi:cytochrome c oxidase subunit 2